jgi:RNA polymerase sigma-70 factor (ECF subfamily)
MTITNTKTTPEIAAECYSELCSHARRMLHLDRSQFLQPPAALVNEAYLRLARQRCSTWFNNHQFIAVAKEMMRRVLIDDARRRLAVRRGSNWAVVPLNENCLSHTPSELTVMARSLLKKLRESDDQVADVVEHRLIFGRTMCETATILGLSRSDTVQKWNAAIVMLKAAALPTPSDVPDACDAHCARDRGL